MIALALGAFRSLGVDGFRQVAEALAVDSAGDEAPAAAEQAAAAILSYDHCTLEADRANAEQFLTPEFAEEYTGTFDRVVVPAARDTQAVVTAEVQASGVVRASEDRVRGCCSSSSRRGTATRRRPAAAGVQPGRDDHAGARRLLAGRPPLVVLTAHRARRPRATPPAEVSEMLDSGAAEPHPRGNTASR